MTDVTAQAFREAADQCANLLHEARWKHLLLAAAEQREQLDAAHEQIGVLHADNYNLSEQIATLTAERDEARHAQQIAGDNPLQHELLDLITLMPDPQTQQILDYILELRAIRAKK